MTAPHFYSRPCGRGDLAGIAKYNTTDKFLLTPLREGRLVADLHGCVSGCGISTHAPAGGATETLTIRKLTEKKFLLTPLREGRPVTTVPAAGIVYFYSRPCGRGDG